MKSFKFFSKNESFEKVNEIISAAEYYRRREIISAAEYYRRRDNEAMLRYRMERQEERQRQMRVLDAFCLESKLRFRYERSEKIRKKRLSKTIKGRVVLFLESLGFKFNHI